MLTSAKASFASRASFLVPACAALVAVAIFALPQHAMAADITTYFGNSGMNGFFNDLLKWSTGPLAQVIAVFCVIGALWRLRSNFEWGEAGTTIVLIILIVGILALIPTIWTHLQGSSCASSGSTTCGWGSGMLF